MEITLEGVIGTSARIRLRLFGRFAADIEFDGAPPRVAEISGKLRRALIGYLAMQPGFAETRERLAALLWGESADKQARQSLRQCLVDLRREFDLFDADPFIIDRDTVALDPALISADAQQFIKLAASDDAKDMEQAAALYTGVFMEGIDLDAEAFDAWLRGERARVEAAAALLFERQACKQDEAANGPQAVRAAERLVALDPLREQAQRLLLRLLARYRGRDAALVQADAVIRMLAVELDAEPEPETLALIDQIRSSPAAPQSPLVVRRAGIPEIQNEPQAVLPPARALFLRKPALAAAGVITVIGVAVVLIVRSDLNKPLTSQSEHAAVMTDKAWQPLLVHGITADDPRFGGEGVSTVVVLPFTFDGAAGSDEQHLADHVTTDLINDLSRVRALRVISRSTSRLYAGRNVDISAVGGELGVRYVVEGDVRLLGPQMRINIALSDTKTRLQVWSERFERDSSDRFAAQDEIVRSLARHLQVSVMKAEDDRRVPVRNGNPAIDDLLAKGWGAVQRGARQSMTTNGADYYFGEVLRRDPANVSALNGLGAYHIAIAGDFLDSNTEQHIARAEEVLDKALALQPDNTTGLYFRGIVYKFRGQPQQALATFGRAIELNPSLAPAYANSGHVLYRTGKFDEAIEHVRYAMRLSPKDPNQGRWALYAGQIEIERGRDEAAIEWLRKSIELGAGGAFNKAALAAVYSLRGDDENAQRYAAMVRAEGSKLSLSVLLKRLSRTSDGESPPSRLLAGLKKALADDRGVAATPPSNL